MKELKKIGTVVLTLEEYAPGSELFGNETIIPMYLADSIIHLKYLKNNNSSSQNNTEEYKNFACFY